MVLNQKLPERKNWSQSIHYNGSEPKIPCRKEKLVIEHTLKRGFLKTTPAYGNKGINEKKQLHTQNCY